MVLGLIDQRLFQKQHNMHAIDMLTPLLLQKDIRPIYEIQPKLKSSPHFSPGSREQAQELARLSHQMDEP
jgi:hypothetical protein